MESKLWPTSESARRAPEAEVKAKEKITAENFMVNGSETRK